MPPLRRMLTDQASLILCEHIAIVGATPRGSLCSAIGGNSLARMLFDGYALEICGKPSSHFVSCGNWKECRRHVRVFQGIKAADIDTEGLLF